MGSRRRSELGLDHQPVAVLGQCIADIGELGLLAFALAIELGLRIGGRSVRVVAARLAVEVALAAQQPWRGARARLETMQAITARASFVAELQRPTRSLKPLDHLAHNVASIGKNA
jgi:hypothetical protein